MLKNQEINAGCFCKFVVVHYFQMRMSVKRENTTVLKSKWNARTSLARTYASVLLAISGDPMGKAA